MLRFTYRLTGMFTVAVFFMVVMAPIPVPAMNMSSSEVSDASIIGDFLVCRPLGMAATIVGTSLFVVSLPFSALGDNVGQAARMLVTNPARFTFSRPLGNFYKIDAGR